MPSSISEPRPRITFTVTEPPLSVDSVLSGGTVHIRASGDVDYSTAPLLTDAVRAVTPDGPPPSGRVVVELDHVRFLDSSGVATLLECRRLVQDRGGRLVLQNPSPAVVRTLELAGLLHLFGL